MENKILLALLLLMSISQVFGQVKNKPVRVRKGDQVILPDTTFITKRDTVLFLDARQIKRLRINEDPLKRSSRFYDSLGEKVDKDVFELVLKKKGQKERLVNVVVKSEDVFLPYSGYTIGLIIFKSVDLLEGSVIDTLQKTSTRFGKFINKVHRDTRTSILSQNLLFESGDKLDPFKMADNERVLRQFRTLRDARIYLQPRKSKVRVVDVIIVTQDVASLGIAVDYESSKRFRVDVYDINVLGYAKQIQLAYFRSAYDRPVNGYEITFRDQNLMGSFVQGELQYTNNYIRQRTRLSLGRDFFTPEIKYAGGVDLYHSEEKFYAEDYDTLRTPYKENNYDFWAGRSFEVRKRTNIILSARVSSLNFPEKPFVSSDSNSFFYDRTLVLGSLTLVKRNYLKSLRIRGFGRTEDIPVGAGATLTLGKEVNEFKDRSYFGLDGTFGKYFSRIGYISVTLLTGSFIKGGHVENGMLQINSTAFSDLIRLKKTQMRQFVYFSYIRGLNRIIDKTVSLEGKWKNEAGLLPLGNRRMTIGIETVYFMPWYVYGFQFALFYRVDFNLLATAEAFFQRSSLFYSIRAGVRVLNENLVLPSFSLDLAYYGKNKNYDAGWEFKFSTGLVNLFNSAQLFKPRIGNFE
ncbi:MAG: hypothetical protein C0490_08700 [Marivirga sp.]|nr:hypothetical protein [Marivirga sp.]